MSGPVRTPDEMLPADAASGAGRTPAGRPAVRCGYCGQENVAHGTVNGVPVCTSLTLPPLLREEESAREHVRNALQLLNVFDHAYRMDAKLYYVYDGADIEVVVARLRKALGQS